jgi:hypothetical protein
MANKIVFFLLSNSLVNPLNLESFKDFKLLETDYDEYFYKKSHLNILELTKSLDYFIELNYIY